MKERGKKKEYNPLITIEKEWRNKKVIGKGNNPSPT